MKLLNFIKLSENKTCSIYDPLKNKLLKRLKVDFSHLNEHNFRHNFSDTLNLLSSFSLETENTAHFFLRCQDYTNICVSLRNKLDEINTSFLFMREPFFCLEHNAGNMAEIFLIFLLTFISLFFTEIWLRFS